MTQQKDNVVVKAPSNVIIALIGLISALCGVAVGQAPSFISKSNPAQSASQDANQVAHDAIQQRLSRLESQIDSQSAKIDLLIQHWKP